MRTASATHPDNREVAPKNTTLSKEKHMQVHIMSLVSSTQFLEQLDRRAVDFEAAGGEAVGRTARILIGEVRQYLAERDAELLTLTQAETESGYTYDHLRKLVAEGAIPNYGRKGKPMVRRGDLPMKPKPRGVEAYNAAADIAEFLGRKRGAA
jgi:hypothetical protein